MATRTRTRATRRGPRAPRPRQASARKRIWLFEEGNAFLNREFPRLDYIKSAKVETSK